MKGRPSSRTSTLSNNNKVDGEETQSHLSGAYIRSLVKQLTSSTTSRTKEKMNQPKEHELNSSKQCQSLSDTNQAPPQPHRKQVRRRLHTSRPYQERLLNMAEARREIVAALKFHRASMKQQEAEKAQPGLLQQLPRPPQPSFEQDEKIVNSRRNPRIYPSSSGAQSFQDCLENLSFPLPPLPTHISSSHFSWNDSLMDVCPDSLDNLALPSQTLGLNLNFQDFSSLEGTPLYHPHNNSISSYSSSSSSPPPSVATIEEVVPSGEGTLSPGIDFTGGGCSHTVMNDEVMEEIRSIGEQHQIAWDDTMDLVTSAWWFKFLKTMEVGNQDVKLEDNNNNNDVYQYHPFDQVMEFPSWINANEACFLQPLNATYCSEEHFQDSPLPCMDIGEIEVMDEEWLS